MKQDWDLIRKILLKIEGLPKAGAINSKEFANEWIDSDTVAYTIIFLFESVLVDGIFKRGTSGSLWCEVARLTSEGSQFLDAIKLKMKPK